MSRLTPLLTALALAAVLLPAAALNAAQGPRAHPAPAVSAATLPLTVQTATVVAVPPGATETSVFFTLKNSGQVPVVLTGARSELARHVMLMTTRRDAQGRTGMQGVSALTVPAGGRLTLSASGDHLMLMNLTRVPKVGQTVRLTLTTRAARSLTVDAVVRLP